MKWKATRFPGVRFREHQTRKHGIQKDRYFAIRYQREGKRKEEGLGWSLEGWTAEKAANELHALKKAHTIGEGPDRLSEKRRIAGEKKVVVAKRAVKDERDAVTFQQFFLDNYWPIASANKTLESLHTERVYFDRWIKPIIGDIPFKGIAPIHVEKIKSKLLKAKKAPRTVEYVFAIIRQIWNIAKRDGFIQSESPTKDVKKPKISNKRQRFLSKVEADELFKELKSRSVQVLNMALLSLHCGLRASEIFRLTWGCIDLERGIINVDGKGENNRPAFITEKVDEMLRGLNRGKPDDLVFHDRHRKKIKRISNAFQRSIKKLKLNDGITDRRQKIVFHSLRHTFASWHVESGTDLYVVQKLMGHASSSMTERYAHLASGTLQKAVKNFELKIQEQRSENEPSKKNKRSL